MSGNPAEDTRETLGDFYRSESRRIPATLIRLLGDFEVPGNERYRHAWNGARWHFASAENRDAFVRNPERYAPQYGGYCAHAVSHGYTADGDRQFWKIVDRRLYLNYNREAPRLGEEDIPGNTAKGNGNWPGFLEGRPEHKG